MTRGSVARDARFEDLKGVLSAACVFGFCGTYLGMVSIPGECSHSLLLGRQEKQLGRLATGSAVTGGVCVPFGAHGAMKL